MNLWVATQNKGKVGEFQLLLQKEIPAFSLKSIADLSTYSAPPENGKTYEENARIKARSFMAMKPGEWVFGEDSGIEVTGLGNLPGIHSARYAGDRASDSENVAKILKMIQIRKVTDRSARFVCTIVAFSPAGSEHVLTGEMLGSIAAAPSGNLGFGYDPVFIPLNDTKTLAQLGPGFKIQNSHRTQAFLKLTELMKK
jgi:XTP/dITP diphosphohydrolase